MCFGTEGSAVVSSDIVGYQKVTIPYGYSIFTATFQDFNASAIDLNSIVPQTPAGVDLTGAAVMQVYVLDTEGNYGDTIAWFNSVKGWSKDNGATKIADGSVMIANGQGFAINNGLKMKDGVQSTARGSVESPAVIQVSGLVDLVCKNAIPYGYSINGNSTPEAIDLNDVVPQTPAGVDLTGSAVVQIYTLDTEGNYGDTIAWFNSVKGWSKDNGATKIADGTVVLAPGQGFAINNGLKVKDGVQSTARGSVESAAILKLPSPLK